METKFHFCPTHFNWAAIHPKPIGVINFIGGAFFGTFPTLFYHRLLGQLFEAGYTIIAIPFRFTFQHWDVAVGLVKELYPTLKEVRDEAKRRGYEYQIYEEDPCAQKANYFWLGHSLGTKYIGLLEYLSDFDAGDAKNKEEICNCAKSKAQGEKQVNQIIKALGKVSFRISIKNQPSVLMAPDISNTKSAIRIGFIADLIDQLGWGVTPTKEETFCLIERSNLYGLMALIAFESDKIAKETVHWLRTHKLHCQSPNTFPCGELPGGHLKPLDFQNNCGALSLKVLYDFEHLTNQLNESLSQVP